MVIIKIFTMEVEVSLIDLLELGFTCTGKNNRTVLQSNTGDLEENSKANKVKNV